MSSTAAQLHGIHHRYGAQQALQNVTLTIPGGCLAGIIGPDGVGKSTLLELIAGVRRRQSGQLEVLGEAQGRRRSPETSRRIAYMPQGLGSNLYPTLSVEENLEFFARLFSLPRKLRGPRMHALLEATDLADFKERPASKLSGGMKQKLALCCALIQEPDLLILDEPTTGVDPLSRRQFWGLINRLRHAHPSLSVLVASAYMEEAREFDWLAMMHDGQVIAAGSPADLLATTGTTDLDDAFVALLPRTDHHSPTREVEAAPPVPVDRELAIRAQHLSRRFGDFVAVNDVSFDIYRGEIFGFLGSNGCGKSTTMKMLTGLLPVSSGDVEVLGKAVDASDLTIRHRIGYMSQSFSLYGELTVQQNLILHGRIYGLSGARLEQRLNSLLEQMELSEVADRAAGSLPLGQRQRLSLAVAIIHEPEVLILDEPTSGVDPIARDQFWILLQQLARHQQVTIFISTHYLNEARRCDRISLMHAGRVLAQGTPEELVHEFDAIDLEDAFIKVLLAADAGDGTGSEDEFTLAPAPETSRPHAVPRFDPRRLWAWAAREWRELWREPVRIAFALAGPIFLMLGLGYGINFDVENLRFAVLDQDQSPVSRDVRAALQGSRYFQARPPLHGDAELLNRLAAGDISLAVEIPPDFGRKAAQGQPAELAVWIDGSTPFHAERARAYMEGANFVWQAERQASQASTEPHALHPLAAPYRLETRFRYNPSMETINAIGPGMIAVLMTLIPAMLMAVAIVREKELGSITNFYTTPTHRLEFLWGKQLPYVGVAMLNFLCLVLVTRVIFGIELKGSPLLLWTSGLLYALVAPALGLLISSFTRTQIAALFAALIITIVPALNFSGLLKPTASLEGVSLWVGTLFPTSYLLNITVGTFTKGLGFAELWPNLLILFLFFGVFTSVSAALLSKEAR